MRYPNLKVGDRVEFVDSTWELTVVYCGEEGGECCVC